MAQQREESYLVQLRRNRSGQCYFNFILDEGFNGYVIHVMELLDDEIICLIVGECEENGYDGDGEELSQHQPRRHDVRRMKFFTFRLSDAIND